MKQMKCENCGEEWGVDDYITDMLLCPKCIRKEIKEELLLWDNI